MGTDAGSTPSGTQWRIRSGEHHATVVEVGGGLRTYHVAGKAIVDGYGEDELAPGAAGQILAPWPNRIRDGKYVFGGLSYQLDLTEPARHNAAHGLVNWVRWVPVEVSGDAVTLRCALVPRPGYPWALVIHTTWLVGPEGLQVAHEVTNLGSTVAPFGLGAHPYIRLPGADGVDDMVLSLPSTTRLLVDGRMLPIGAERVNGGEFDFREPRRIGSTVLDCAYAGGSPVVTVSTEDGEARVEVWSDESFRWWQVFSADTLPADRARRALAIEPMTCPPDAFRSLRDLIILEPGQIWRGAWGIRPVLS